MSVISPDPNRDKPVRIISDLRRGAPDPSGHPVQEIYSISFGRYAVYRADDRVSVMFADDATEASWQRNVFAPLEILRGEIDALMEGWFAAANVTSRAARRQSYQRKLADGLILAFRELPDPARAALEAIKADLLRERTDVGRRQYMIGALGVGLVWVLSAALISFSIGVAPTDLAWTLTGVVASGCSGALFSLYLNLSGRLSHPDTRRSEKLLNATLRVSIGVMSALILYALLKAGLVVISLQGQVVGIDEKGFGLSLFLASVLAGLSERLVGNLLGTAPLAAGAAKPYETEDEAATQPARCPTRPPLPKNP